VGAKPGFGELFPPVVVAVDTTEHLINFDADAYKDYATEFGRLE